MKRCEYCNSIWVCWNWFHQTKSEMNRLNRHLHFDNDVWGHECWQCEGVQETQYKVKNGIPYFILKHFYKFLRNIL